MGHSAKKLAYYFVRDMPLTLGDTTIKKEQRQTVMTFFGHEFTIKEELPDGTHYQLCDCGVRSTAMFNRLNAILIALEIEPIKKTKEGWFWQGQPFPLNTPLTFMEETHKTAPNFKK